MDDSERAPLPPGTLIEYCGIPATVMHDDGGQTLEVKCAGVRQRWFWTFDGAQCTVAQPATALC